MRYIPYDIHLPNALRKALEWRAAWQLRHPDGSPYLTRTVLWGDDCLNDHTGALMHAFVHEIHSADGDRHMHDHPWAWAVAVVLSGGYEEDRTGTQGSAHRVRLGYVAGDCNVLHPGVYHSIVSVLPNTVTLFLAGREVSDWGFLVEGQHVPHGEYFKRPDVQAMKTERLR